MGESGPNRMASRTSATRARRARCHANTKTALDGMNRGAASSVRSGATIHAFAGEPIDSTEATIHTGYGPAACRTVEVHAITVPSSRDVEAAHRP